MLYSIQYNNERIKNQDKYINNACIFLKDLMRITKMLTVGRLILEKEEQVTDRAYQNSCNISGTNS